MKRIKLPVTIVGGCLIAIMYFYYSLEMQTQNTTEAFYEEVNFSPNMTPVYVSEIKTEALPKQYSSEMETTEPKASYDSELLIVDKVDYGANANEHELVIEEIYNDSSYDINGIDIDLVQNGKMFTAPFNKIKSLTEGSIVKVNLLGQELEGVVEKNIVSKNSGNTYVKVGLGQSGRYINVYYGKKLTKGKAYTPEGAYIFQQGGEVGFILPIFEYKKIKNALVID